MRAVVAVGRDAGAAGLAVHEVAVPRPSENDVLVRVHAAGFTRTELQWPGTWRDRAGHERTSPIPGHELSGVVAELGYGTTGLRVGQRVFGFADGTRDGTLAEYVAVEARNLAPLPPDVEHVTAAALPISGLAAWQALFVHAGVGVADRVLVTGAEGAVGTLAVQLAAQAGAHVVAVGHHSSGEGALRSGAVEYLDADDDADDGGLSDLAPVDLVLDVVGGPLLEAVQPLVRRGGAVVSVYAPLPDPVPPGVRALFFVIEPDRPTLARLAHEVRTGRLRPRVDAVCDLADASRAFTAAGRTIVRLVG